MCKVRYQLVIAQYSPSRRRRHLPLAPLVPVWAATELRVPTHCRSPLSLSLSRVVVPPCRSTPLATARCGRGGRQRLLLGAAHRRIVAARHIPRLELLWRALYVAEAAHLCQVLDSTKSCLLKFRNLVWPFASEMLIEVAGMPFSWVCVWSLHVCASGTRTCSTASRQRRCSQSLVPTPP
jgi:hypothetical protein